MKIVLFTIVNWDCQEEADQLKPILEDWNIRSSRYFKPSYKYIIAGSWSNPIYNPLPEITLLQSGFEKQFFPKIPINYWKCGLMCALHHFLSMSNSWDIVVYYHYCLLTSIDFTKICDTFKNSQKSMCAINRVTPYGTVMDTGLMIMKKSAVQKWILQSSAGFSYTKSGTQMTTEEEAQNIFEGDIYNPFPEIISMHHYQSGSHKINSEENPFNSRFDLSQEEFINNPIIFGYKHHCCENDVNEWKRKHPVEL